MIICPNCKEEIDDSSHYCDQCGHELFYCKNCGRVGMGRRCTHCGGLMASPDAIQQMASGPDRMASGKTDYVQSTMPSITGGMHAPQGVPILLLINSSLNIRLQGVNGAIIGRRQGPYSQFFEQNMYVSGVHAQLLYKANNGWCVVDKHSSNGTKLNQHPLQPDVEMSLKSGDILTIANINMEVNIK